MNHDRLMGRWRQWVGCAKESWGLLTHDGLVAHAGRRERVSGLIQQRYGRARDDAAHAIAAWEQARRDGHRRLQRRARQAGRIDAR